MRRIIITFVSVEACDKFRASYTQVIGVFSIGTVTLDPKAIRAFVLDELADDTMDELRRSPGVCEVEKDIQHTVGGPS